MTTTADLFRKITLNSLYGKFGQSTSSTIVMSHYEVLSRNIVRANPVTYTYSVKTVPHVMDWLQMNYVSGEDYWVVRHLKGVWIDMTEQTFIMFKLKWS